MLCLADINIGKPPPFFFMLPVHLSSLNSPSKLSQTVQAGHWICELIEESTVYMVQVQKPKCMYVC